MRKYTIIYASLEIQIESSQSRIWRALQMTLNVTASTFSWHFGNTSTKEKKAGDGGKGEAEIMTDR